jgi:hypothetical protein
MSEVESTMDQTESNDPLWQVQLPSGQVCRMTLELLDDAFQDGLITEDTLIMQDGTTEWVTLREVAGLDAEAEAPASGEAEVNGASAASAPAAIAEIPVAATAPAAAPVQPALQSEPRPYMDPFAPAIQAAPSPVAAQQMVPPGPAQAAPFVFQAAQNQSFAQQTGFASALPEPLTRSTAPVAADIDFDLDTVNFGKKRSPAKWIVGIAAVLGGLGFAAMNMNSAPEAIPSGPSAAAAAPAAPPAYESIPSQPAPITPAVSKPALSDDAKRALMEADKNRAAKMQQQKGSQRGGGSAAPSGPRKKSDPFHKGGDKYDPLNASL